VTRTLIPLVLFPLLLLAVPVAAQLDPAACKLAKKDLLAVTQPAAFEHKVQLVDSLWNLAFTLAFPMVDSDLDSFDADSVDALRDALDGWAYDMQEASVYAAGMVRDQIPLILAGAFGDAELYGLLPPGFLPGDGSVLDDFRAKLAKQQAKVQKAVDKVLPKVAAYVRKNVDVELEMQVLAPEVPWVAGDRTAALARLPELAPLDVLVAARSDTLALVGTRLAMAGNAADELGAIFVQLTGCDGVAVAGQSVAPLGDRWAATFADVTVNPVIVRVLRGDEVLAERSIGFP